MATRDINYGKRGNNSSRKVIREATVINSENANTDKIAATLWMQNFAHSLKKENVIDDKQYNKLLMKIDKELNRRYGRVSRAEHD